MKTVNVEDLTWKTLSEMKLKWGLASLDAVINRLIVDCVQTDVTKKPQTALSPDLSQCTPGSANVAVCPDTKSTQVKGIRTNGQGDISENTSVHKENIKEVKE